MEWADVKYEIKDSEVKQLSDIHFIVKTCFGISAACFFFFVLHIFKLKAKIYSFILKHHAAV